MLSCGRLSYDLEAGLHHQDAQGALLQYPPPGTETGANIQHVAPF